MALQYKYYKYYLLTLGVIVLDQIVKLLVHFKMDFGYPGQIRIFDDWFKLYYTTNPGMAFGFELGSPYGKLILSLFRIIAMIAISIYLYRLAKKEMAPGMLWCIALILGGAIGNVIDSTFYGVLLNNAPDGASTPWFHGQVIDMFYIDIWEGRLPEWIPIFGGEHYAFWPIFNIADAAIFIGVCVILIWQKRFFKDTDKEDSVTEKAENN